MAQLRRELTSIHGLGAELIIIGNGTEHFANAFREDLQLETPLYIDPTCTSYRALGMRRGIGRTLGWRMWLGMARAIRDNIRHRRFALVLRWWHASVPALKPGVQGDAWQLGGVLIVQSDGSVAYRYLSTVAGDHPPVPEVLAALSAATGRGRA